MDLPDFDQPSQQAEVPGTSASTIEDVPVGPEPRMLSPLLTREALQDELKNFAQGELRNELQQLSAQMYDAIIGDLSQPQYRSQPQSLRTDSQRSKHHSPGLQESASRPLTPGLTAGIRPDLAKTLSGPSNASGPGRMLDMDTEDHEWLTRHMRRFCTQQDGEEEDESEENVRLNLSMGGNRKKIENGSQVSPGTPNHKNRSGKVGWQPGVEEIDSSCSPGGLPDVMEQEVYVDGGATQATATKASERIRRCDHTSKWQVSEFQYEAVTVFDTKCCIPIKRIVKNPCFDYIVGVLVVVNSVMIGVQVDVVARRGLKEVPVGFRICETCFAIVFTVELSLRIVTYWGRFLKTQSTWNHWNIFDCLVVGLQVIEEICTAAVFKYSTESPMLNFSVFRVLRLLRFVRIIRLVRVLRSFDDLRVLVTSITRSWRPLCWTVILLVLNIYLVAVYFTQLVHDNKPKETAAEGTAEQKREADLQHHFGSLSMSCLSLFQAITGGKDWDDLTYPLMDLISPFAVLAFSCYILFTVIAMMNVVTGVFVESAIKSAKEDKDTFMINNMREVFRSANGGITGVMTWETFERQLDKPMMQAYFRNIDVDPSEAKGLFQLLDLDGSGFIDCEEFLSGCIRLRGPAKALDMALLMHEVRRMTVKIHEQKRFFRSLTSSHHTYETAMDQNAANATQTTGVTDRMAALCLGENGNAARLRDAGVASMSMAVAPSVPSSLNSTPGSVS